LPPNPKEAFLSLVAVGLIAFGVFNVTAARYARF
jgi:hypothetical protein